MQVCDRYSLKITLYSVDPASCGPESIILSMAFFSAGEQICNNTQHYCTCPVHVAHVPLQWTAVVVQPLGGWIYLHITTMWIPVFLFSFSWKGVELLELGRYLFLVRWEWESAGAHGMNNCSSVGNVHEFQWKLRVKITLTHIILSIILKINDKCNVHKREGRFNDADIQQYICSITN